MEITLKFQPVSEGLPPKDTKTEGDYSIKCAVIARGQVIPYCVKYCFGKVNCWETLLSSDVTHWAPWPQVPQEVPIMPSPVWVDDDLLALY
jgi:hypothetical protein